MFGVVFAAERRFWPHLKAAIASLRHRSPATPVDVYTDGLPESARTFLRAAGVREHSLDVSCLRGPRRCWPSDRYRVMKSRFLKTAALARQEFEHVLYLDSDVLVKSPPAAIQEELDPRYIWMTRRSGALDMGAVSSIYLERPRDAYLRRTLNIAAESSPSFVWWNSGVIYGSGQAINRLGHAWNAHLLLTMRSPEAAALMKPSDQLSLWAALQACKSPVRPLPASWNSIPASAPGLGNSWGSGAHVLHFERWKNSAFARRLRASAIAAAHRRLS